MPTFPGVWSLGLFSLTFFSTSLNKKKFEFLRDPYHGVQLDQRKTLKPVCIPEAFLKAAVGSDLPYDLRYIRNARECLTIISTREKAYEARGEKP